MKHFFFFLIILISSSSETHAAREGHTRRHFLGLCASTLGFSSEYKENTKSLSATTLTWEIHGPDSNRLLSSGSRTFELGRSVGEITIDILRDNNLYFQGNQSGIYSIEDSPTGDNALEVLNDTQMRSYGWCYSINGVQPQVRPDQYILEQTNIKLVWYYGYVEYNRGIWSLDCIPATTMHFKVEN